MQLFDGFKCSIRSATALCVGTAVVAMLTATPASVLKAQGAEAAAKGTSAATMSVLERWKLGGSGGWDYLTLDGSGARLFISRGDHVDVVDTASGKKIGAIADTKGVHGIAIATELKRGYVSNGKNDSVTVFDLDTLKTIKELPITGHNPDAILYVASDKRVYTFNGRSKDVTVLDAQTLATVATIPVPDKPEFAADDGQGQIFLNIESEAGQMVVIDTHKLAVKATWPLPGCASPSGLALDNTHHRLFSVCDAKVMAVTDAETGKQVGRVKIGEGPDAAAFDSERGIALSSNGEGTLTVIHQESPDTYRVLENVATQRGARTMAFDPVRNRVYLVTADFGPAPAPTAEQPHPRPAPISDSFTVLVVGQR